MHLCVGNRSKCSAKKKPKTTELYMGVDKLHKNAYYTGTKTFFRFPKIWLIFSLSSFKFVELWDNFKNILYMVFQEFYMD